MQRVRVCKRRSSPLSLLLRDHTLHGSLPPHGPMSIGARLCDGNQDKQWGRHGSLKASVPNKKFQKRIEKQDKPSGC